MLAIQAHCHAGHIQLTNDNLPQDAEVVVYFLPKDLSAEQHASWIMQSQNGFATTELLNPAEDCWNDV